LLSGKPGTGKTAFVKNIGLELDLPIFVFDLSSLDNEELSLKMTETTEHTPYIMLIEDIDSVFNGRENISGGNLTFDCLINHLDGIADDFGRLLFITTNHPDKLDLALIRPGRLDETFEFKFITYNDRLKMTSFYNVFSELSEMVDDCPVVYFKNLCEIIAVKKRYNEKIDIDKLISITIPEEYQNTKELV
jgi:chaperone BCS1